MIIISSVLLTISIITDISTTSTIIVIGVEGSGFSTAASCTHMHLELPLPSGFCMLGSDVYGGCPKTLVYDLHKRKPSIT